MLQETADGRVLRLFADILDYPPPDLVEMARECDSLVSATTPEAASLLREFRAFVEETPGTRVEEIYTGIFDLDPVCHPYVGYHLFGESYKRSAFLLELKERYRAHGFVARETELPDRLSILLRFLAMSGDEDLNREIIHEGLLPALDRMTREGGKGGVQPEKGGGTADVQLEGHSQGEILRGGSLLQMVEDSDNGSGRLQKNENPYRQVLRALRLVLQQAQQAVASAQGRLPQGGSADVC